MLPPHSGEEDGVHYGGEVQSLLHVARARREEVFKDLSDKFLVNGIISNLLGQLDDWAQGGEREMFRMMNGELSELLCADDDNGICSRAGDCVSSGPRDYWRDDRRILLNGVARACNVQPEIAKTMRYTYTSSSR